MKTFAIVMMILVVALAGVMGYALFNTALVVEGKGMQVLSASQRMEDFEALREDIERGTVEGALFDGTVPMNAADYNFYVYTLRLKNNCLVPAEMVEVQLSPGGQDVLCYDEKALVTIAPGESRDVWCVLLTRGTPSAVRELTVTYYLWGNAQTVKYTYE